MRYRDDCWEWRASHAWQMPSWLDEIDVKDIPSDRQKRHSTKWSVLHDGKHYPPKYLISIANQFRNNEEWDSNDFSGGSETNKFLK